MAMGIESYYSYPPHVSVHIFCLKFLDKWRNNFCRVLTFLLCLLSGRVGRLDVRVMNLRSAGVTGAIDHYPRLQTTHLVPECANVFS